MNRLLCLLPTLGFCLWSVASAAAQQQQIARPPITGIARVQIFVTDVAKAEDFYAKTLRLGPAPSGCSAKVSACLVINNHQQVQLIAAPSPVPPNLLAEVTFATADAAQMRRYLISKGFSPEPVSVDASHVQHFSLLDPDGHPIGFVQLPPPTASATASGQVSTQLIHGGFIVRDREAEDRFYKDILGFHLYWHGGMKDDEDNWASMQVPDGTDWIEYMLRIPPTPDHHTRGVMNHIALGVTDIQAAKAQLLKNNWKPGEEPKIGRDGKWQLNLYDPDETRIEFMEFKPVEKPCCSDFTGPQPQP